MANRSNARRSSLIAYFKSSPNHKSSYWAGAISIFILGFFALGKFLGDILYSYPTSILPPDTSSHNTAIICLAGGKGRIEAAFELYASGVGSELYIVGAGKKISMPSILKNISPGTFQKISVERREKISIEMDSKNTIENAYVVDHYIKQHPEIKNFIILTSSYHMKRSLFVLNQLTVPNTNYLAFTPPNEGVNKDNWYKSKIGLEVTSIELGKYISARILIPQLKFF